MTLHQREPHNASLKATAHREFWRIALKSELEQKT